MAIWARFKAEAITFRLHSFTQSDGRAVKVHL